MWPFRVVLRIVYEALYLSSSNLLQLLQRPRPIVFEQSRQTSIRQKFPARLAFRAVVGFVFRVDDALHRRAADRAGLAVLAVHGHVGVRGFAFRLIFLIRVKGAIECGLFFPESLQIRKVAVPTGCTLVQNELLAANIKNRHIAVS